MANIVGPSEAIVVSTFHIELDGGGGDLHVTMPYSMIDKGPTVLVRNADGKVDVLEDENPGAFYKGPIEPRSRHTNSNLSYITCRACSITGWPGIWSWY